MRVLLVVSALTMATRSEAQSTEIGVNEAPALVASGAENRVRREHVVTLDDRGHDTTPEVRRTRWSSPLARNRWMFRFGWFWAASPRSEGGFGVYLRDPRIVFEISAGFRARVGRWLTRFLRIDLGAHLGKTWHLFGESGVESGANVELMAVSDTRLRMGAGLGFGVLVVREPDATGNRAGWVGWWASMPTELGFDFFRRSGLHVHVGPTLTRAPYMKRPELGLLMSVEGEIDVGWFE